MIRRSHVFVDGENLVFRYQEMLKSGKKPLSEVKHISDVAVWSSKLYDSTVANIRRISFYTSCVGDDARLAAVHDQIQSWLYTFRSEALTATGRLAPKVFKKEAKSHKSRQVDIHITMDALVSAYTHDVEEIILLTGDSDFIPVIQQLMRHGKEVTVGSFSSGLSPNLPRTPDSFFSPDDRFFE